MMQICADHRGAFIRQEYLSQTRVQLVYDLPLAEIIYDFYDKLKSATRGYGTLNYEVTGFHENELVKLRILVNNEEVDGRALLRVAVQPRFGIPGRERGRVSLS